MPPTSLSRVRLASFWPRRLANRIALSAMDDVLNRGQARCKSQLWIHQAAWRSRGGETDLRRLNSVVVLWFQTKLTGRCTMPVSRVHPLCVFSVELLLKAPLSSFEFSLLTTHLFCSSLCASFAVTAARLPVGFNASCGSLAVSPNIGAIVCR